MTPFEKQVRRHANAVSASGRLDKYEQAVLSVIYHVDRINTKTKGRIKQKEVAYATVAGSHPLHENYGSMASTTRAVRGIVEKLRNEHGVLIISLDSKDGGYWLARTEGEARAFENSARRKAISQARSQMDTCNNMRKVIAETITAAKRRDHGY